MTLMRFTLGTLAISAMTASVLTGCSSGSETSSDAPIRIGIVHSRTGAFADRAVAFENGLRGGIDYLTKGTNEVDGRKIELVFKNDNGDPATGVNAAKTLLGDGIKIIAGPDSSAIAVPVAELAVQNGATYIGGASGTTELLGMDKSVFQAYGGTTGLNAGSLAALGADAKGKTMLYLGQDYAYGQDAFASLKEAAKPLGIEISKVLLPQSTRDFTAGVLKVKAANADVVFVGWQGDGASQLYNALGEQDIFSSSRVVAQVVSRNAYAAFAESAGKNLDQISIGTSYFAGAAPENAMQTAMIDYAKESGTSVDYTHPVGFVAAQMIVRAIEEAGPDLDPVKVSKALSGWSFDSPLGKLNIRAEDHLLMVPQFEFKLVKEDNTWVPQALKEHPADTLQAPVLREIK